MTWDNGSIWAISGFGIGIIMTLLILALYYAWEARRHRRRRQQEWEWEVEKNRRLQRWGSIYGSAPNLPLHNSKEKSLLN